MDGADRIVSFSENDSGCSAFFGHDNPLDGY